MPTPIGVSFIPTADNQAMGPQQNSLEGTGGSDLAQTFKILSLRFPQVLGAGSLAPQRLLTAPGATGPNDPNAAVLKALLLALAGGMGGYGGGGGGGLSAGLPGLSDTGLAGTTMPTGGTPPPNITPGSGLPKAGPEPPPLTYGPSDPNAVTTTNAGSPYRNFFSGAERQRSVPGHGAGGSVRY